MAGDEPKQPSEAEMLARLYEQLPGTKESGSEKFVRLSLEQHAHEKAAADAPAPPATIPDTIDQEEFARWYTPRQAVHLFSRQWEPGSARIAIRARLKADLLAARAEHAVFSKYGEVRSARKRVPVPSRLFKDEMAASFWTTGQFEIKATSYSQQDQAYVGVRLDPVALHAMLETPIPAPVNLDTSAPAPADQPPAKRTRHGLPGLHDDLLEAWAVLFKRAYPKGTKGQAETSARGMFPANSIDREVLREMLAKHGIGKSHSS